MPVNRSITFLAVNGFSKQQVYNLQNLNQKKSPVSRAYVCKL